eukprot:scaffold3335_cov239-Alexandrium_tamarense.AAC.2
MMICILWRSPPPPYLRNDKCLTSCFFVSTHLPINSQAAIHHRNLLIHPVPFQGERMDANWDSLEETYLCNSSSPLRCSFLLHDSLSSKPSASPSDAPSRQP